ncbi:MAG TPA: AAA family ATPase [Actinomycetota bacterium]
MDGTTVVLGFDAPALQEQVLRFIERRPGLRIAGAAGDAQALTSKVRETGPQVVITTPDVLAAGPELNGAALLVVGERETTAGLRAAIRAGARGFYLWPEERDSLGHDADRAGADPERPDGRVVAVYGPRGGVGTTFLATNLAAACAGDGRRVILADLDLHFADVTTALGIVANGESRTIADVAALADDLGASHLEAVLHRHPRGFEILLAPPRAEQAADVEPEQVRAMGKALRSAGDLIVLHVPRALDRVTLAALEAADEILLVVTLDVLAFRDAKRAMELLAAKDLSERCRLVVNRARRAEVLPDDAERVFGLRPVAVIASDPAVPRAQDRGQIVVGRRGQAGRKVAALARSILKEGS